MTIPTASPEDLASARERLTGILGTSEMTFSRGGSFIRNAVFDILEAFPSLAGETFAIPFEPKEQQPPLCHFFLMKDANVAVLKIVYKVFPDVLKRKGGPFDMLPLHFVSHPKHCRYLSTNLDADSHWRRNVIAFMVEKHPEARSTEMRDNLLPIHLYLRHCHEPGSRKDQYEKIAAIADLLWCDDIMEPTVEEGKKHIDRALFPAIQNNNQLVLQYLMSKIPEAYWLETFHFQYPSLFDFETAHGLAIVASSKLQKFTFNFLRAWNDHPLPDETALQILFETLATNAPYLQRLVLMLPWTAFPWLGQGLKYLIRNNQCLEELVIAGNNRIGSSSVTWFDAVVSGLSHNQHLQKLTIGSGVRINYSAAVALLHNGPRCLTMKLCDVLVDDEGSEYSGAWSTSSRLEELTLARCCFHGNGVDCFLAGLAHFHCLKKFEFQSFSNAVTYDTKTAITTIVQNNPLTSLILQGFTPHIRVLFEQMKTNTCLETLKLELDQDWRQKCQCMAKVLKDQNDSLVNFSYTTPFHANSLAWGEGLLDYYCLLNQHGLRKSRQPETCKADMVRLLSDVIGCESIERRDPTNGAVSMLYELLRQMPSIWHPTSDRKRKHSSL